MPATSRAAKPKRSGLGAADEVTLSQLHPLTQEAAGVLLGRPGLGRRLSPGTTIRTLRPGQRVFHLVVGRRPLTTLTRRSAGSVCAAWRASTWRST